MDAPAPRTDELLRKAIEQKRLIRFTYKDKPRIVEPHDYGVHKGSIKLFGYQVGGLSSEPLPNWRWALVNSISDLDLLQRAFSGRYASVKRFVNKIRGSPTPEARVVIETAPGAEAQVDYGSGPMVRDPQSGKYRRTRLFVMTLGHSRKAARLLVFRSSSRIWAELHE